MDLESLHMLVKLKNDKFIIKLKNRNEHCSVNHSVHRIFHYEFRI